MNDVGRVCAHAHFKLGCVVEEYFVPQFVGGFGTHPFGLEDFDEALREIGVPVGVAHHGEAGCRAEFRARDTAFRAAGFQEIVLRRVVTFDGGRIRREFVCVEGIFGEVVIRRADIGVPQAIARCPNRGVVVAFHVIGAHDELDVEALFQVEEFFFLVANDEVNVVDPPHSQLANLALDEHLAAHDEHPLGAVVGDWRQAARQACCQNYSVFHFIGLEGCSAFVRDAIGVGEAAFLKRTVDRINRSD